MCYPYVIRTETQTEDFGKTIGGSHRQAKKEKEFRRKKEIPEGHRDLEVLEFRLMRNISVGKSHGL